MAGIEGQQYELRKTDFNNDSALARVAVDALAQIGIAVEFDVIPLPPFAAHVSATSISEMVVRGRRQNDMAAFLDLFTFGREETTRRIREESAEMTRALAERRRENAQANVLDIIVSGRRQAEARDAAIAADIRIRAQAIAEGEVQVASIKERARRAQNGENGLLTTWYLRRYR